MTHSNVFVVKFECSEPQDKNDHEKFDEQYERSLKPPLVRTGSRAKCRVWRGSFWRGRLICSTDVLTLGEVDHTAIKSVAKRVQILRTAFAAASV